MDLAYAFEQDFAKFVNSSELDKVLAAQRLGAHYGDTKTQNEQLILEEMARCLVRDASANVRQQLAFELRRMPDLPTDIAEKIARDAEDIASAFLAETEALSPEQLAGIVADVSEVVRVTIARRPDVPEIVVMALVEHGGERSITFLVRNPGAEMTEAACSKVIDRFAETTPLMDHLASRDDLALAIAERLLPVVSKSLKQTLVTHYKVDAKTAGKVSQITIDASLAKLLDGASIDQIEKYVRRRHEEGRLEDSFILEVTNHGSLEFFKVAMTVRAGVPLQNVETILKEGGEAGLNRLLQKAHVNRRIMASFQRAIAKLTS